MTTTATTTSNTTGIVDTRSEDSTRGQLSEDQIFHLLQNQRRRWVLKYLEGRDGQVRMGDIAEQVAAWEHDTTVKALTSKERQRVYIPLYQNHLPKLDEEGIIDYNQSRGYVERLPPADQLIPYLDPFENDDEDEDGTNISWEFPYLGATGIGGLLLAGKAASVSLVAGIPELFIGVFILLLFGLTTAAQLLTERVDSR